MPVPVGLALPVSTSEVTTDPAQWAPEAQVAGSALAVIPKGRARAARHDLETAEPLRQRVSQGRGASFLQQHDLTLQTPQARARWRFWVPVLTAQV